LTVECGTIAVPQVRNDPASGTFNLGVAVFRSVSFPSAPDPVVYLAGGPGENALAGIPFIFDEVFAPFLAQRDVIVFDQRGAGFSQPGANCGEFISLAEETLDEALSVDEAIHRGIAASKECRDRLGANGINLSALNTTESAADVDTLRRALGYETWNLLGISYGTRLAQTVMRDYPEGVRSVILDSTVPIAIDLIAATPASIDRAFQALFDACASDAACSRNYPDLEGVLGTAFDLLNETPVAGRVTNVLRAEEFESVATGNDLVDQLFQGLYSTDVIPLLPELITLAAEGDVGLLDLLRGVSLANFDFISTGMGIAVQCREEAHFTSLEALEAGAADLPDFRRYFSGTQVYGTDLLETCAYWDVDGAPPIENEPVVSGIPTLVLAG
jgi:pimeloyl-ACP methyl ester carboxylesterase